MEEISFTFYFNLVCSALLPFYPTCDSTTIPDGFTDKQMWQSCQLSVLPVAAVVSGVISKAVMVEMFRQYRFLRALQALVVCRCLPTHSTVFKEMRLCFPLLQIISEF